MREIQPIDGMDQGEPTGGMTRLVLLQAADEVPVYLEPSHLVLLGECFLHAVLAHISQPGRHRRPNRLGGMGLRDGHDPDLVHPSRPGPMPLDRLPDLVQSVGEVREFHSLTI